MALLVDTLSAAAEKAAADPAKRSAARALLAQATSLARQLPEQTPLAVLLARRAALAITAGDFHDAKRSLHDELSARGGSEEHAGQDTSEEVDEEKALCAGHLARVCYWLEEQEEGLHWLRRSCQLHDRLQQAPSVPHDIAQGYLHFLHTHAQPALRDTFLDQVTECIAACDLPPYVATYV